MAKSASIEASSAKRAKISQSEIPNINLQQALKIAHILRDQFAASGTAPHQVAIALGLSPTSGGWRNLCGASIAYGLTDGGYNAGVIALTGLGRRVVSPIEEGDDIVALREAALKPRIPSEFFSRYNNAKFPRDDIAANVLADMGLPRDRAESLVKLLKENGRYVGFIHETTTGSFVALDSDSAPAVIPKRSANADTEAEVDSGSEILESEVPRSNRADAGAPNSRVFISHGKNTKIMDQIKKVVLVGGLEPVISMQRETAAKPVPDKVMDDMRSCGAAVIHVGSEGTLRDDDGVEHRHMNPNVLIEIGAAMALYKGRFILVVDETVRLPSNLQGLYECRYRGDSIEFDAGLKILEALRGISGLSEAA